MAEILVECRPGRAVRCSCQECWFPDAFAARTTLADVLDEVVGLLLGAYDRGDLGFDVCLDHVDGQALGADLYAEFVTLADDGRVFDLVLGEFGTTTP